MRTKAGAEQYELDRRDGIVSDRAPTRHTYAVCAQGPRCPYPVQCCADCERHSLIKHTC